MKNTSMEMNSYEVCKIGNICTTLRKFSRVIYIHFQRFPNLMTNLLTLKWLGYVLSFGREINMMRCIQSRIALRHQREDAGLTQYNTVVKVVTADYTQVNTSV